ncbi:hypothetical protein BGZ57DRAFT_850038 [Hyaloscypha finlandica]|nr:hypothetical protein BGZ57DRAFT_850038 [Hyaloscypha finlandica]
MKISSTYLVLLTAGVYGIAAREALHTATVNSNGEGRTLNPEDNRNGWVNPEDLAPMPQCIAQQDQSTWLSTMTKCTGKQCTRHFGVFCTHHQWLTQLSCLSTGFSSDVVERYLSYCGRSVLAKAQLYLWIREITGRTWLVDVGDANGLQDLSPASLAEGYAVVDVIFKAPTCLRGSLSAQSMEPFQQVLASYSETVGYDLTGHWLRYGNYFDKECFCSAFTIDPEEEPCSGPGQIDLTKERLWINATCGSTSLPDNWTDELKTTEFAYIPTEDWHWPMCVADMPKQHAVGRACFCRDISYDSCRGSCQIFETRIDYVKWLHGLCGNVQDWYSLPDNWRQLAAPTPLDMIPWRWTLKPSNESKLTNTIPLGSIRATETCASNEWKLGSFALVNIATFLAVFLSQKTSIHRIARGYLWHLHEWGWFSKGTLIAALQLLGNWLNVFLVQNTPGYEDVPGIQLLLLWCSMPRLAWLALLLTVYYMVMTVNYGYQHDFYLGSMQGTERGGPATIMYAGAFMWLVISILALFGLRWKVAHYWMDKSRSSEESPLARSEGGESTTYGTFSAKGQSNWASQKAYVELSAAAVKVMLLLWIVQWLFWGGFIGLSSEVFCPPKLGVLTAVWIAFSLAGATVGAT